MRPAWLVQNDEIVMTGDYELRNVVLKNKIKLEKETRKVGRIDLFDHQSLNFAGTGWLITKNIVCTNRHVAEVFAEQTMLGEWRQSSNRFGEKQRSELSFLRQHNTSENPNRRAIISEVLFVAERNELDLALLKVTLIDEVEPPGFYRLKNIIFQAHPMSLVQTIMPRNTICVMKGVKFPSLRGF